MSQLSGRTQGALFSVLATALLVAALTPFRDDIGLANVGFLFLLLTLLIASYWGREVGLFAAIVANLAFNFFFIDPLYQFTVDEPRNVLALVVFLIVSVVGGTLISMSREAAAEARQREAETAQALALSRAVSGQTEPQEALQALCRQVIAAFAAPGAAVLTDRGWSVLAWAGHESASRPPTPEERVLAEQAVAQSTPTGFGNLALARPRRIIGQRGSVAMDRQRVVALVPLKVGDRVQGVLRLDGPIGDSPFRREPLRMLEAVASEAALAVHRAQLAQEAAHAEALREADALKTALMASISHDLKTPLAGIKAAISSILDHSVAWTEDDMSAFHRTIDSQADRLNRVISDILDLNRIESGALTPEQSSVRVLELLQAARDVTAFETENREVTVEAPADLSVVVDESLIRQALVNLIENAAKYSIPGGGIHLRAVREAHDALITVEDEGPGIAPQDLPYVFERFYRAEEHSRRVKGSGLGLTIVKGFVDLCGGSVGVESSPAGTRFSIRLPVAARAGVAA